MNNFAVFGNPIAHSKSPDIFNYCFKKFNLSNISNNNSYRYTRIFADTINTLDYLRCQFNLKGANITAPFKNLMCKQCHSLTPQAKKINAVNTVLFSDQVNGDNTDIKGVIDSLKMYNIDLTDMKISVVGAGGAAAAVIQAVQTLNKNADISIFNRSKEKFVSLSNIFSGINCYSLTDFNNMVNGYDLIFITIPEPYKHLENIAFNKNTVLFFADYKNKEYIDYIKSYVNKVITGQYWLINQAVPAFEKFTNMVLDDRSKNELRQELFEIINKNNKINNIFLSGFSGSGKTTLAKIIAEKLGMEYVDLDTLIEQEYNMSIPNVFKKYGEEQFRKTETDILSKLVKNNSKKIVSLGGGALENTANCEIVKENSFVVYLYSDLEVVKQRINFETRPLLKKNQADNLLLDFFEKRKFQYFKNSDLIFYNTGTTIESLNHSSSILCREINLLNL
ncbi:MAG: AAA family ATPase [Bacteroidetes bacterium]|nr:AAA family ATPase [Bacteroidota bacterium]